MDKKLTELSKFYGSTHYYTIPMFKSKITEGVKYIMDNGYAWFVTDALAIIDYKLSEKYEFLVVELKVDRKNKTAIMRIKYDDGRKIRVVFKQRYSYTDAEVDYLKLYWVDGILMLNYEY